MNAIERYDVLARIVQAREWLTDGDDLEADAVLRDLEHDLTVYEQQGGGDDD